MARSGQGAGEPPTAITARGSSGSAPRPGVSGRSHDVALALVALGLVRDVLRSRRFREGVVLAAIALGSLTRIGQESRASAMARLSAWNKREMQRLEHVAERQARAVKGAGQMARSGPPRGLAGSDHET